MEPAGEVRTANGEETCPGGGGGGAAMATDESQSHQHGCNQDSSRATVAVIVACGLSSKEPQRVKKHTMCLWVYYFMEQD